MVAQGDAHPGEDEKDKEQADQEGINSKEDEIEWGADYCGKKSENEEAAGEPVDPVKGDI